MLRELFEVLFRPRVAAPPLSARIDDLGLRSGSRGYDFRFSCMVGYQQLRPAREPHPSLDEVARHSVLQRAAAMSVIVELPDHVSLQSQLVTMLGLPRYELDGLLQVWATEVSVVPVEADLQAVRRQRDLERELLDWRHTKELERQERDFVTEMLREPNAALAWWVSRNPQHVAQAMDMIEPLARLSDTVHGRTRAHQPVMSTEDLFLATAAKLFAPLDEWSRALLGDQLAKTLATFGQADLADRVRQRLDTPGLVN